MCELNLVDSVYTVIFSSRNATSWSIPYPPVSCLSNTCTLISGLEYSSSNCSNTARFLSIRHMSVRMNPNSYG